MRRIIDEHATPRVRKLDQFVANFRQNRQSQQWPATGVAKVVLSPAKDCADRSATFTSNT